MRQEAEKILSIIKLIETEYQQIQGLILSEDDLKCLVYKYLSELYAAPMGTMDSDVKAIQLHTEIPWYNDNHHLSIYPDITIILNPKEMSIKHGAFLKVKGNIIRYGNLPLKQFRFSGDAILIEFKFIKKKSGANQADLNRIETDIEKMLRLINKHTQEVLTGIMVIFNKTNRGSELIEILRNKYKDHGNLKILYCTGNVSF